MDSEPSTHPMKKWWLTYSRGISFPERGLRIQTGARQCLGLYFLYLGSRRELGSAWDYIFSIQDLGGSQQCLELYFLHLGSRRELGSAWDYIFSIQDLDGSQVVLGTIFSPSRIQTGARQCLGLYILHLGSRRELGSAWTRSECTYQTVECFDTFNQEWRRLVSFIRLLSFRTYIRLI